MTRHEQIKRAQELMALASKKSTTPDYAVILFRKAARYYLDADQTGFARSCETLADRAAAQS